MLFGKELDGAPSLQEREVVEVGLGTGTITFLLCGVQHEVQIIHMVPQLVV
jgi:16S rRNA A1518/A1519 N6-dimethyltransferase RsmA/KsgA/DIM1 with predicted DNA glycosylase/AP lyase activity